VFAIQAEMTSKWVNRALLIALGVAMILGVDRRSFVGGGESFLIAVSIVRLIKSDLQVGFNSARRATSTI
jgi:hypothetical protein